MLSSEKRDEKCTQKPGARKEEARQKMNIRLDASRVFRIETLQTLAIHSDRNI